MEMVMKKIGFIGCGNMAKAMIGGIIRNGFFEPAEIVASDVSGKALQQAREEFGIETTENNKELALLAEVIVLIVKPNAMKGVIEEITDVVGETKIILSVAAGWSIASIEEAFGKRIKVVRAMPNTPAMVGEAMSGVCRNRFVIGEELEYICKIMECLGKAEVVQERNMDAVVAIGGSAPAYVFLFIEAMADAAVAEGMPRDAAYRFASQTVLGSAKMVLESGKHPGELKDMVCSPGGTTAEAVGVLESKGFRGAVIEAVRACAKKARDM